jgi:hypothetical protein
VPIGVDVAGHQWKNLSITSAAAPEIGGLGMGMTHDGPDVGWYVHLGRLSAATDGALETARGLRNKISEVQPHCLAAATAHEEMGLAAALTKCHGRFAEHFHGHADRIHRIGGHLSENHTAYATAEQRAQAATSVPAALVNREL